MYNIDGFLIMAKVSSILATMFSSIEAFLHVRKLKNWWDFIDMEEDEH